MTVSKKNKNPSVPSEIENKSSIVSNENILNNSSKKKSNKKETKPEEIKPEETKPEETKPIKKTKEVKKKETPEVKEPSEVKETKEIKPKVSKSKVKNNDNIDVETKQPKKSKVIKPKINKKQDENNQEPKKTKSKKVKKTNDENSDENEIQESDNDDHKTRSFKVELPNETKYSGRFTGLTPYQAANKALSKYFRNKKNLNINNATDIFFSIKESSRGSKRNIYNYKGNRIKLETPITYTIKSLDGTDRLITKQYKNQLIKIKKNESETNVNVLA